MNPRISRSRHKGFLPGTQVSGAPQRRIRRIRNVSPRGSLTESRLPSESVHPYTSDAVNRGVLPPRGIHGLHPGDVMPTNEVRGWVRFLREECSRRKYIWRQAIVSRIIERRKRTDDYVLDLFFFHINCGLFKTLSPIDIGIVKQIRSGFWTPREFIEIRNVIGKTGSCRPNLPPQ